MDLSLANCIAQFYQSVRLSHSRLLLLIASVVLLSGCATMRPHNLDDASFDQIDPYEKINRKSYALTDFVDRKVMEPIADFYVDYVPNRVRRSVSNFYDNLAYPNVVLNVFLQGKVRQGF